MARSLSVTGSGGQPSDPLTLLKAGFAFATFLATLLTGVSAYKMLTCWGEKSILTASRFAAGAFLGTAMLELLSKSDVFLLMLGNRYPVAFLLSCTGYLVAMLVDCLLACAVRRLGCFGKFKPKFQDKMMLSFMSDLRLTECCDTTLRVGISKSDTKLQDCDGTSHLRCASLYRATLFVDSIFLLYILGVLSTGRGAYIGNANTETNAWRAFLSATLHNIIYTISSISVLLRLLPSVPFTKCLFLIAWFCFTSLGVVVVMLVLSKNDSVMGSGRGVDASDYWVDAILSGFFSGVLVYLSTHHLLTDAYEMEKPVSDTRLGKFMAVACGIGLIAAVKILDVY